MKQKFEILSVAVAAVFLVAAQRAQASPLTITQAVSAAQGSTGDFFDILFTNTSGASVNIAAFNWEISVSGNHITLDSANESTASPYIFFGNSFDSIDLADPTISDGTANPGPGQVLDGSDLTDSGLDVSVANAATVALGHVFFDVAAGTPIGPYTVTFAGVTSLSNAGGMPVTYSAVNGTIMVTAGAATPEPSTFVLLFAGLGAIACGRLPKMRGNNFRRTGSA